VTVITGIGSGPGPGGLVGLALLSSGVALSSGDGTDTGVSSGAPGGGSPTSGLEHPLANMRMMMIARVSFFIRIDPFPVTRSGTTPPNDNINLLSVEKAPLSLKQLWQNVVESCQFYD
jgi:hypothetical protein